MTSSQTQATALEEAVKSRDLALFKAFAAEYNFLPPPWVILPHAHPTSIGWRMGYGESFVDLWGKWWEARKYTGAEQVEYFRQFRPPHAWLEWVILAIWPEIEEAFFDAPDEDGAEGRAVLLPYFEQLEKLGFGSFDDWLKDYKRLDWDY